MKKITSYGKIYREIINWRSKRNSVQNSVQYLVNKRNELFSYEDVEEFVIQPIADAEIQKACEFHLMQIRSVIARVLWSEGLYIGVSALDSILFDMVAHDRAPDPVRRVLERIRDLGLHYPGIIIFPVHSFGVLGAGLLHARGNSRVEFIAKKFGVAVTPQTNKLQKTIEFLERSRVELGIKKRIPKFLIQHWHESRPGYWLERNPLMVVRVQNFPGSYYENQFLLMNELRQKTALLSMLATLQPKESSDVAKFGSSSVLNNFQTLDFKHYLALYNAPGKIELHGDCVPINLHGVALAEISNLGIELKPEFWTRRHVQANRIFESLEKVLVGFVKFSMGVHRDEMYGRVYRKFFNSLTFYRRSFNKTVDDWQAVISLAIAFEMLLTDEYAAGVTDRIKDRVAHLLKKTPGKKSLNKAVEDLYNERGSVVHTGFSKNEKFNVGIARLAFVHVFVAMADRLERLKNNRDPKKPMDFLTSQYI